MPIVAGLHDPAMAGEFVEVADNAGAVVPSQNGGMAVNVGVTFGVTVIVIGTVTAHWPAVGVKV